MDFLFQPEPVVWLQEAIGLGHPGPFRFLSALGTNWGIIVAGAVALWLFGRRALYALVALVAIEALLRHVMSITIGVPRPDATGIVKYERVDVPTFPSGHTATAAVLWIWLGLTTAVPLAVGFVVALASGIGRLYLGTHYVIDVVAAIALGALLAWGWTRAWPWLRARMRWSFAVWVGIAAGAVALVVASGFFFLGDSSLRWQAAGLVVGAAVALPLEWRFVRYRPAPGGGVRIRCLLVGAVGLAPAYAVHLGASEGSLLLQALSTAGATVWAFLLAPAFFVRRGWSLEGEAEHPRAVRNASGVAWAVLIVLALIVGYGGVVEPRFLLDVEEEPVSIPGLPESWEGARVAAIGDLQVGMWGENDGMIERIVERIVADRPALVLIAGDFVYGPTGDVSRDIAQMASLLAPLTAAGLPVYGVLGNHDWDLQSRRQTPDTARATEVVRALAARGVHILANDARALTPGGRAVRDHARSAETVPRGDATRLWVVGIGSRYAGHDRADEALSGVPADAPRIVLMHHPDSFERIPAGAAPLAVAGHTHGGQIALPGLPGWSWIGLGSEDEVHADGWIQEGYGAPGNRLYVNRGIGFSLVPVRINAPPELTYFVLRSR